MGTNHNSNRNLSLSQLSFSLNAVFSLSKRSQLSPSPLSTPDHRSLHPVTTLSPHCSSISALSPLIALCSLSPLVDLCSLLSLCSPLSALFLSLTALRSLLSFTASPLSALSLSPLIVLSLYRSPLSALSLLSPLTTPCSLSAHQSLLSLTALLSLLSLTTHRSRLSLSLLTAYRSFSTAHRSLLSLSLTAHRSLLSLSHRSLLSLFRRSLLSLSRRSSLSALCSVSTHCSHYRPLLSCTFTDLCSFSLSPLSYRCFAALPLSSLSLAIVISLQSLNYLSSLRLGSPSALPSSFVGDWSFQSPNLLPFLPLPKPLPLFAAPQAVADVRICFGISRWYEHGENRDDVPQNFYQFDNHIDDADVGGFDTTTYHEMLHNVAGPSFNWNHVEESPNPEARQLYDMIEASSEQLWPSYETMTTLSAMARLLAIKSEHHISERGWDDAIHENLIRAVYDTHAGTRYTALMHKLKKNYVQPNFVIDEAWRSYLEYWDIEDFLVRFRQVSTNRNTEVEGPGTEPSKHSVGLVSFVTTNEKLTNTSEMPPIVNEVYFYLHTVNHDGVTFVDTRSEWFYLQRRRLELTKATPDQPIDDEAVYFNVAVPGDGATFRVRQRCRAIMTGYGIYAEAIRDDHGRSRPISTTTTNTTTTTSRPAAAAANRSRRSTTATGQC
ncbi:hypothetical protein Syun_014151 [Stephania yunnanensis]|uniref:Uncharacterized protein n=1 Tax=Stephania yunnanensis TaxID=152371 RepID=A0AAP0JJV8_9MAGN